MQPERRSDQPVLKCWSVLIIYLETLQGPSHQYPQIHPDMQFTLLSAQGLYLQPPPSGPVVKKRKIHLPMQETWVQSLGQAIPWRRRQQPTPVFLPGISYRQRSLVNYSPWGHKRAGHDLATKQEQQPSHPLLHSLTPAIHNTFKLPSSNLGFFSHPVFLPAVPSVCNTSTYLFPWLTPIYSSDLSVSLISSINPSFPDLQNWVWIPASSLSSIFFTNRHILGT